ncbi:uncharacterized protein LOC141877885 isoform X2 [Acropora palmata]|uniref:uncharacterized protein LOC141877885 isoform X2 n=1 Tax=Acropora palmata TaxID=6131 RepID=UPI003DA15E0C
MTGTSRTMTCLWPCNYQNVFTHFTGSVFEYYYKRECQHSSDNAIQWLSKQSHSKIRESEAKEQLLQIGRNR